MFVEEMERERERERRLCARRVRRHCQIGGDNVTIDSLICTETELGQAREAASAAKAAQISADGELSQSRAEAKNLAEDVRKLRESMTQLQQDLDAERGA